jgi:hypothetical protein
MARLTARARDCPQVPRLRPRSRPAAGRSRSPPSPPQDIVEGCRNRRLEGGAASSFGVTHSAPVACWGVEHVARAMRGSRGSAPRSLVSSCCSTLKAPMALRR